MGKEIDHANDTKCPYCPKKPHNIELGMSGDHLGVGTTLGGRLMKEFYPDCGSSAQDHPFTFDGSTAQAHHLICSETMRDDKDWKKICATFGYDINCIENGVFLPSNMKLACHLRVPLHKSNHELSVTNVPTTNYVKSVRELVDPIKEKAIKPPNEYCDDPKQVKKDLDNVSKRIWKFVDGFIWTITKDGRHYHPFSFMGCSGLSSLSNKEHVGAEVPIAPNCPTNRVHTHSDGRPIEIASNKSNFHNNGSPLKLTAKETYSKSTDKKVFLEQS